MPSSACRLWPALFLVLAVVLLTAGSNHGQDQLQDRAVAAALNEALRDVINVGAVLFNKHADYAGCYRVYQGGLIAAKPFLAPKLQKRIDSAIARAEEMPQFSDRAFELRRVLDDLRAEVKEMAGAEIDDPDDKKAPKKKVVTKKPPVKEKDDDDPKKKPLPKDDDDDDDDLKKKPLKKDIDDDDPKKKPLTKDIDNDDDDDPKKKPLPKEDDDDDAPKKKPLEQDLDDDEKLKVEPQAKSGRVQGVVTFDGELLPGGFFVTLVSAEERKFSTLVQQQGMFRFATLIPPGEYRVLIEPVAANDVPKLVRELPMRYRDEETSGLLVHVGAGENRLALALSR